MKHTTGFHAKLLDGRIYVAGHRGMVGGALLRELERCGVSEEQVLTRSHGELDLRRQADVEDFFREEKPAVVIFAAAKVGGIHANDVYSAEFLYDNLAMASNAIEAAYRTGTRRFLFLGSTCIYPKLAPQPIPEDCLLSSSLEPTNEAYALAKIAGLKLCQHYRKQYGVTFHSAMPTNLYGPGDNYHPENSHVLPALIRRFDEAARRGDPSVTIWGTGKPRREFLYVDDLARALVHLLTIDDPPDWVNVGTGKDISIRELASLICDTVRFRGDIQCDTSKPDGTPVKRTDISRIRSTGWEPTVDLREGVNRTYNDYLTRVANADLRSA